MHTPPSSTGSDASTTNAASLMSGNRWDAAGGTTAITYSFSGPASRYGPELAAFSATQAQFSAQDRTATRDILAAIEAVCNVKFTEVDDAGGEAGQIRYAYSGLPNQMGYTGFAFFPSSAPAGGDVWLGSAQAGPEWAYFRPGLILHETLHALGLKHPFEGAEPLDEDHDVIANTVMSDSPTPGSDGGALSSQPRTPMPLDILALQQIYGQALHKEGDTVYDLGNAQLRDGFQALWDSGGVDTLDASHTGNAVAIDLHAGARSDIGVSVQAFSYQPHGAATLRTDTLTLALAPSCVIENAVGSAFADTLVGNEGTNVLRGGAGDDLLAGAGGDDRIDGGEGSDTAEFAGMLANFRIEREGDGFRVTDRTGAQGTDLVTRVETLRFQDVSVNLTMQDMAAATAGARLQSVVELYVGFFNRVPDAQGLGFWLDQMNAGMTTRSMAENFYAAAQAHSRLTGYTADMNNADFVKVIYKNVLGRPGVDAEGLDHWCTALADGCETRGSLLEAILQSAHSFRGDAQFGQVERLLANKFSVSKTLAVDMGLTWNSAEESIARGMQIAAAVTSADVSEALRLIGFTPQDLALG